MPEVRNLDFDNQKVCPQGFPLRAMENNLLLQRKMAGYFAELVLNGLSIAGR